MNKMLQSIIREILQCGSFTVYILKSNKHRSSNDHCNKEIVLNMIFYIPFLFRNQAFSKWDVLCGLALALNQLKPQMLWFRGAKTGHHVEHSLVTESLKYLLNFSGVKF